MDESVASVQNSQSISQEKDDKYMHKRKHISSYISYKKILQ